MKPILFNTEMVRAILDGRKTVTRRAVKPPALYGIVEDEKGRCIGSWYEDEHGGYCYPTVDDCSYQPGDVLYVRETWTKLYYADPDGYTHFEKPMYFYAADGTPDITLYNADGFEESDQRIRWHPSIHMPKEAARIFLRVKGVSVERLQEITKDGARAEGVKDPYDYQDHEWYEQHGLVTNYEIDAFAGLWDSTTKKADLGKYGWAANPFVWVISFERISKEEALKNES